MAADFEILLASDFTARSDRPLERALRLARDHGGRLVIAHVLEKNASRADAATLQRLRADLPPEARDAELVVRPGAAPKVLAQIAAERASTLIVTGVARYNSVGDYVLGTAVDHIVRNAGAAVLIVRRRALQPYAHFVVATDFSACSRAALVAAAALFPEASITAVHAFHVPYEGWLKSDDVKAQFQAEARQQFDAFLGHPDVAPFTARIDHRIVAGELGEVVRGELRSSEADLLVLGTHGRSGLAHATLGSQAEALLPAVDVDVLMVRERP